MERVTIDTNGFGWTGDSSHATISDDGRYVAVSTVATEDGIDRAGQDIYLIDLLTGDYRLVSFDTAGSYSGIHNGNPVLSSDGSEIAFSSSADNLVPGQTVRVDNVFITNIATGTNEIVSTPVGTVDSNGAAMFYTDSFSGDGRYVGFSTTATDLSVLDVNSDYDVYMTDRTDGSHELISVSSAGAIGNSHSLGGSMSDNGRYVVFYSAATNLTAGAIAGQTQVYLRDTQSGTTSMISTAAGSADGGQGYSTESMISADGSIVVYLSLASDLVAGDANGAADLFVWNRSTGQTMRIDIADTAHTTKFDISDDGRYIVFDTIAALAANDTNATRDIYVYDTTSQSIALVSQSDGGVVGGGLSVQPAISGDGQTIVFQSNSENLTAQNADSNNWTDVYATDNPLFSAPTGPNVVTGTSGKDTLSGTSGADIISGRGKADTLDGKAGDDVLKGGGGKDVLIGGEGADDLRGGTGNDTASYITASKGVRANLTSPDNNTRDAAGDTYSQIENLTGSNFRDILIGDSANNTLTGGKRSDTLSGKGGDDVLKGGAGADTLRGQVGDDRLIGGTGNDLMQGGAGHDAFVFAPSQGNDVILDFQVGTDRLVLNGSLAIQSLTEVDTDTSGGVDATLVTFTGGTTVLLENLLNVADSGDLL